MMKVLCGAVLSALLLAAARWAPPASGPPGSSFKQAYVSPEGRVIDPSDARKNLHLPGRAERMACFFALAANDRAGFDETA